MKHNVYGKHLGRTKNQRTALFKSLVGSLILQGSIVTTESKAKAIKGLVDKIISQAKSKNTQRLVSQFLVSKNIQDKLFKEVVPGLKERNSGFTSVVKMGRRAGDNAMTVKMSLLTVESKVVAVKASKDEKSKVAASNVVESKVEVVVKEEKKTAKTAVKKGAKK